MIDNKCPLPFSEPTTCNELEKAYKQGGLDMIAKCTEILARLVTMELLDLNTYELVKAEMEQAK